MRLIDADALIDTLGVSDEEIDFKEMLREAPTIDIPHGDDWERYSERLWKSAYERGKADRPQGEWTDNGDRYFRCSLCGTKDTDKWHWCHGCGARMKGADDGNK